jgi:hypothetical protein
MEKHKKRNAERPAEDSVNRQHNLGSVNNSTKPEIEKINRLAYTTREAAAALGIDRVTLWRLTQRGLIRANRATRRPLYAISEIERFLNGGNQ